LKAFFVVVRLPPLYPLPRPVKHGLNRNFGWY